MREFKLVNSTGAEWNMMRRDGFFHMPFGFGYARNISTLRAGNTWLISDEILTQKTPSGEMVFLTYKAFQDFVSFISKDEPLYLMYKPMQTWYRCRCKVQQLDKGDMTYPGVLICPIMFSCFGTWSELVTTYQSALDLGEGKVYDYSYPYQYADTSIYTADIKNGDLESPVKLHIFGPVVNPAWALIHNGENIASGRVNVTIPEGNKLIVDANPATMEIAEYTRNNIWVADRYQSSDFSTARFIYAPPGASTITATSASGGAISLIAELERSAYAV